MIRTPSSDDAIALTRGGAIATLWLNRPSKRNSVTYAMWQRIAACCAELAADDRVRLLVVRGAGDHFCAGADITGLNSVDRAEYQRANQAAEEALAFFAKPTIAFISGSCVGGGCQIAIACDLRLADSTARFGITPARLGLVYPAYSVERAVSLIGASATKHLLYSAELIDCDRALRVGLIDEVLASAAAAERLDSLCRLIAEERSLLTQEAAKAMIADITHHGSVQAATSEHWEKQVAASTDPAEGVRAFVERRTPRFEWRAAAAKK